MTKGITVNFINYSWKIKVALFTKTYKKDKSIKEVLSMTSIMNTTLKIEQKLLKQDIESIKYELNIYSEKERENKK